MRTLTSIELKMLLDFFEGSPGYVLDFSDASFNEFTEREVGVRVKDLYRSEGLSKHKSLCRFCNTRGNEEKAYKLLSALMTYYDLTQRDSVVSNERREREYLKCKGILRAFSPIESGVTQLSLDEMNAKFRALYKEGALFLIASSEDKITIGLNHLAAFLEAAILNREWRVFAHPLLVRVLTDLVKLGGDSIRPTEAKLAEAAWREFGNKVNALLLLISKLPDYSQVATTVRQELGLCFQRKIVEKNGGYDFYRSISSSVLAELLDHFKWMALQCHPRFKDIIELMYCGIFNNEWESFDFLPLGKNDSGGEPIPDDFLANAIPVRPRTRIEEVRLAKSKWLKDHADIARRYNLAQIEMDLLAAMPEASEWRFFKACTLLEKTIRGAVERFDPLLGYWPWFKWGLSILSKSPYANRNRSKQDVQYIVGDISQAIADVIVELLNWQKTCYKTYFFEVDGGSPLAKAIFDNLGEHETAKGSTEKIVEQIQKRVFMPDGDMIRYDGAVFDAILAACPYNLLEPTDFPEDIVSEVVAHDIFFIEENDMGWYDGDFDKWHNDAVVKIDLARQAKEREKAQKTADKTEEEGVERQRGGVQGKGETAQSDNEGNKRGRKSGRTGDAYDQFVAAKKLYENPESTFYHNANGAATKVLGWVGTAKDGHYEHALKGYSLCGTYAGVKSLAKKISRTCNPSGAKRNPGRKLRHPK